MSIKSVYSEKVELRESEIEGKGTFAKEAIGKGEVVFIKGGHVLPYKNAMGEKGFCSHSTIDCYWPIDDNYVIGASVESELKDVKLYINHSCDPNCGIRGDIVGVAMRDIDVGEEITFDYAMLDNENYSIDCKCGSKKCRGNITGKDWRLPELQTKYSDFFATYLKEKIKEMTKVQ